MNEEKEISVETFSLSPVQETIPTETKAAVSLTEVLVEAQKLEDAQLMFNDRLKPETEVIIDTEPPHQSITVGELRARDIMEVRPIPVAPVPYTSGPAQIGKPIDIIINGSIIKNPA